MEYFKHNNIKSIKLENDKLTIEYNNKQKKETKEINNQELEKIKSFAEKLGKTELSLSDLEQSFINQSPKSNKGLYICLAVVGGILVIGLVAWLLMRNRKEKYREYE